MIVETSLVVWWLRICFPMQEMQVRSLDRELRCLKATKLKHKKQKQYCDKFNTDFKMVHIKKKNLLKMAVIKDSTSEKNKDDTYQWPSSKGTSHKHDLQSTGCNNFCLMWKCRGSLCPCSTPPWHNFTSFCSYGKLFTLQPLTSPCCLFYSFNCFPSPFGHMLWPFTPKPEIKWSKSVK